MGFQPMIDAYEEWTGASWTSRRELLAFSAGAEVLLRVKDYGSRRARGAKESRMNGAFPDARGGYSNVHWTTYKPPDTIQGLDDITCLRLLRSLDHVRSYQAADGHEPIIFGTAKGDLKLMKLPLVDDSEDMRVITSIKFDTKKRPVRSIDLTADGSRLAACLSDAALAVYPISIDNENTTTLPSSEIDALGIRAGPSKRLWSTRWLSSDQLAVGLGPSDKPLHVYQVTESGLDAEPIRKFGIDGSEWGCDDRVDLRPESAKRTSSVYPIITLPTTAQSGDSPGDVFLTGCYDGIIRLHDMRSPHGHVGSYWDPIDDSAIYSLQTIGRERLAAGSAQNCAVKFFDLRVSGGRAYHYLDVQQGGLKFKGHPNPSLRHAETKLAERRGWNLFLSPRTGSSHFQNQLRLGRGRNAAARELRRLAESPIYSLCNPSPSSPTLFAGLENFIAQVDITCMTDKHPDPLFSNDIVRYSNSGDIDPIATWDRDGDVVDLAMYEHSLKGGIDLKVQVKLGDRGNQEGVVNGLDERWRERPKWRS